jgi:hypothetical protein
VIIYPVEPFERFFFFLTSLRSRFRVSEFLLCENELYFYGTNHLSEGLLIKFGLLFLNPPYPEIGARCNVPYLRIRHITGSKVMKPIIIWVNSVFESAEFTVR